MKIHLGVAWKCMEDAVDYLVSLDAKIACVNT